MLVKNLKAVSEGKADPAQVRKLRMRGRSEKIRAQRYLKIDSKRLDKLVDLVGELLINKMRLEQLTLEHQVPEIEQAVEHMSRLVDDLQFEIMQARMVPVSQIFDRFPRLVRDLAQMQKKKIGVVIKGGDIELDRTVLDRLGEPMIHLIRNAVDHGIEPMHVRKEAGKTEQATITLSARRERSIVVVEVKDDGRGFDVEKISAKAISEGLATKEQLAEMTPNQIMQLAFSPSFSTAENVTQVSGRGVGLDVVKTMIQNINAVMNLSSERGKGTTLRLELPLTLAIIKCFLVQVAEETFALPMTSVERYVRLPNLKSIEEEEVFIHEGKAVPLVRLRRIFGLDGRPSMNPVVIIVERAGEKAGLLVDSIVGEQEIIMKPLTRIVNTGGFAGATILGDGTVALILDINILLENEFSDRASEASLAAN
jgi:two-component system chemotaxis sensor kinase CheA